MSQQKIRNKDVAAPKYSTHISYRKKAAEIKQGKTVSDAEEGIDMKVC